MSMDDLQLTQLLASRLCHDLVGTASAVNTGLELLDEMGGDPDGSAMGLVRTSAKQMAARLQFFRVAFGAGSGAGDGELQAVLTARTLTENYLAGGNIALDWPAEDMAGAVSVLPAGDRSLVAKLFLNLVLIGCECLPRGGTVALRLAVLEEGIGIAATAAGRSARLRDETQAALTGQTLLADLTAHTVQPFFTTQIADALGGHLEIEAQEGGDTVQIAALISEKHSA